MRFGWEYPRSIDEPLHVPFVCSPVGPRARACAIALVLALSGCSDEELPVVARGRYVELATDRDDPICGGTVAFMDQYVEGVAALLGETLPDRVFVRYEWLDIEHGVTSKEGDQYVVRDDLLLREHALVHAVHRQVWPASRPFMHEGLAVLLDGAGLLQTSWPEGVSLDPLLEADRAEDLDYFQAWFFVSQVVRDHGFEGLRELWHAVAPDATASEVRDAYQRIFDRPITALFEPDIMFPGEDFEVEIPRTTCYFTVCVGEQAVLQDDRWSGKAPSDCEDEPLAVGPNPSNSFAPVWRPYVVELTDGDHRFTTSASVGAFIRPCELRCSADDDSAYTGIGGSSSIDFGLVGPSRIEVGRRLEDLPAEPPGELEIERLAP